jgi:hypothetical protein
LLDVMVHQGNQDNPVKKEQVDYRVTKAHQD